MGSPQAGPCSFKGGGLAHMGGMRGLYRLSTWPGSRNSPKAEGLNQSGEPSAGGPSPNPTNQVKEEEMSFELLCAGLIAMIFGLVVLLNGYKVFLVLLPIWGFIFGFALGAETLQALFGYGFLASVTSWAVGFIVGAVFAVLSYLFWIVAVALFSASIGYGLGVGLMGVLGIQGDVIVWLVGVAAGVALAAAVIMLNLQKWIVIIGTALIGAGAVVGTLLVVFGVVPQAVIGATTVRLAMQNSTFWLISYVVLFVVGVAGQYRNTRNWMLTPAPDRW